MDFEIRRATLNDAEALAKLCGTVQRIHVEARPRDYRHFGADNRQLARWFRAFLRAQYAIGFIAEAEQIPIGYVTASAHQTKDTIFSYARKILHIDQMSVEEAWRGRGVGSTLMEHVVTVAKNTGVDTISLDVGAFNEMAIAFYERHDFAATTFTMTRRID